MCWLSMWFGMFGYTNSVGPQIIVLANLIIVAKMNLRCVINTNKEKRSNTSHHPIIYRSITTLIVYKGSSHIVAVFFKRS